LRQNLSASAFFWQLSRHRATVEFAKNPIRAGLCPEKVFASERETGLANFLQENAGFGQST